jgi:hypothetical protein
MMSAIVKTLKDWWATLDGDEAVIVDIAITTIEKLEKYKANAKPRLYKLDALEAEGVDNWEWYDEAMSTLAKDEDDE